MKLKANQQIALKPQDLVVLFKLIGRKGVAFTYAAVGKELVISPSEVHASLERAKAARLLAKSDEEGLRVNLTAIREFVLHGAAYAFPAVRGSLTRGVPTAHAAPAMRDQLVATDEPIPVWPYAKGTARGIALQPLYPSVPQAIESDAWLYDALSLFDALRIGSAREREIAANSLNAMLV